MLRDKTKERLALEAALLRANKLFEKQKAETEAEAARAQVELTRELARFAREVERELAGEGLTPNKAAAQAELEQAQAEARASIEALKRASAAQEVEAKAAWERVKAARTEERKALFPLRRPEETGVPIRTTRVVPPWYERVGEALRLGLPDIPARLLVYGSEFLNVETAGDDRVCQECEDIADDGPYSLLEAQGLIPAHPNCRCTFVPAFVTAEEEE